MSRILNERRTNLWGRFLGVKNRPLPEDFKMPRSPEEAARAAFQKGLQTGYGEGLVDGVDLGMDIGIESAGTTAQPIRQEDLI